jgi:hypothetical protein
LAERSEDLLSEHATTANSAVLQQAALSFSQPAHSATPVDIGLGHMGLDDAANSTSTQPLDQAMHDALSKALLVRTALEHLIAGEKVKLAPYLSGDGNFLDSATAFFTTLDKVLPVDLEDIHPHKQPASYKEDAVLRLRHLQADSTGHPPAVALMELFVELLAQFAEPTEAPDDLPDAHKDLLMFMSIFDVINSKPKFRTLVALLKKVFTEVRNTLEPGSSVSPIDFCVVKLLGSDGFRSIPSSLFSREQLCSPAVLPSGLLLKLLSFWGGALQPPPLFESGKAANMVEDFLRL